MVAHLPILGAFGDVLGKARPRDCRKPGYSRDASRQNRHGLPSPTAGHRAGQVPRETMLAGAGVCALLIVALVGAPHHRRDAALRARPAAGGGDRRRHRAHGAVGRRRRDYGVPAARVRARSPSSPACAATRPDACSGSRRRPAASGPGRRSSSRSGSVPSRPRRAGGAPRDEGDRSGARRTDAPSRRCPRARRHLAHRRARRREPDVGSAPKPTSPRRRNKGPRRSTATTVARTRDAAVRAADGAAVAGRARRTSCATRSACTSAAGHTARPHPSHADRRAELVRRLHRRRAPRRDAHRRRAGTYRSGRRVRPGVRRHRRRRVSRSRTLVAVVPAVAGAAHRRRCSARGSPRRTSAIRCRRQSDTRPDLQPMALVRRVVFALRRSSSPRSCIGWAGIVLGRRDAVPVVRVVLPADRSRTTSNASRLVEPEQRRVRVPRPDGPLGAAGAAGRINARSRADDRHRRGQGAVIESYGRKLVVANRGRAPRRPRHVVVRRPTRAGSTSSPRADAPRRGRCRDCSSATCSTTRSRISLARR